MKIDEENFTGICKINKRLIKFNKRMQKQRDHSNTFLNKLLNHTNPHAQTKGLKDLEIKTSLKVVI